MPSAKKKNRKHKGAATPRAGGGGAAPTSEEKQAQLRRERAYLTELLGAALAGDAAAVLSSLGARATERGVPAHRVLAEHMDGARRTALHFACLSALPPPGGDGAGGGAGAGAGAGDIVATLLREAGGPPTAVAALAALRDADGLTPLMLACQRPHAGAPARVRGLVAAGAAAAATSDVGAAALHYAAAAGASAEVLDALLGGAAAAAGGGPGGDADAAAAAGAVHLCSSKSGTPLHWAAGCAEDRAETMAALLERGADLDAPNVQGMTPLIMAAMAGNEGHCRFLIERGAARGMVLGGGYTVFHIAAEMGQAGTLAALIKRDGEDENGEESISAKCLQLMTERGDTVLDLAAQGDHCDCVTLLSGETEEGKVQALIDQKKREGQERRAQLEAAAKEAAASTETDAEESPEQMAARLRTATVDAEAKAAAAKAKAAGNAHFARKQYAKAVAGYTAALSLDPADAACYSNRSAAHAKLARKAEALRDAEVARHLRPGWAQAHCRVASARSALGEHEEAACAAFEGLEIDGDNEELKALLRRCIEKGRQAHAEKTKREGSADGREHVLAAVLP